MTKDYIYFKKKPINTILDFNFMKKQRRKEWHEYVKTDAHISEFKLIDFPTFKLKHEDITIDDVPDPKDCLIEKINHFALTFNAYQDNKIEKEFNSNESNFYDQYFNEGKFKESLLHLRAILFYTQRGEHMSGPSVDYDQRMRQIIMDIRNLLIKKKLNL